MDTTIDTTKTMDTTLDTTQECYWHTKNVSLIDTTDLKDTTVLKDTTKNGFHYWHHTVSKDWRAFSLNDTTDTLYLLKTESVEFFSTYSFTIKL